MVAISTFFHSQVIPALPTVGHVLLPAVVDQIASRVFFSNFSRITFGLSGTAIGLAVVAVMTPKSFRYITLFSYFCYKAAQVYVDEKKREGDTDCTNSDVNDLFWNAVRTGNLADVKALWTENFFLLDEVDGNGFSVLDCAVMAGYRHVVEWVLKEKPFLLRADAEGRTPLHVAAQEGHIEVLELLHSKKPRLLKRRVHEGGLSVLECAVGKGHKDVVKWILERAPSLLKANADGWTPLHVAAQEGHIEVLELLHSKKPLLLTQRTYDGASILGIAACGGHEDVVKWILERDPSLLEANAEGWTPLHVAAREGHVKVLELLHSKKPLLLMQRDNYGYSILDRAAEGGHGDVVKWILERTPAFLAANAEGWTPLHGAAREGHVKVLELLHSKNSSLLTQRTNTGSSILDLAVQGCRKGAVNWILERAPSLLQADAGGWTPLHLAAQVGYVEVLKLLHAKNSSLLERRTNTGSSILDLAVQPGHEDAVEWILERAPSLLQADAGGWTPLHLAAQEGHVEVLKLLYAKDSSLLEQRTGKGFFILELAINEGHEDVVRWILKKAPSLLRGVVDGWTPLHLAAQKGHIEISKLLCAKDFSLLKQKTNKGTTPCQMARASGHDELANWLQAQCSDAS